MRVIPVLVAYHSVAWIRVAVESYAEHFPGDRILVVDNNPRPGEEGWVPDCERERRWLETHPAVLLTAGSDDPRLRTHGGGLDEALDWCRRAAADVMLLFEPDCLITGHGWRDNLVRAIAEGSWMSGGHRQLHGTIHPAPSAWAVSEVRASFEPRPWAGPDEAHPRFRELVDLPALFRCTTPEDSWIRQTRNWDVGHRAWFQAAVHDRAALVPTPGFKHYWHGSWLRRFTEFTVRARFPELGPYLECARRREPPRPVTGCSYRMPRRGERAGCRLILERSGATNADWSEVSNEACEACCRSFPPSEDMPNPVVASLLYSLAERVIGLGGVTGCSAARAAVLLDQAEQAIDLELS